MKSTEVLLLGSFHFSQSSHDLFSAGSQEEIGERLAQFSPDAIAVEAPIESQVDIHQAYTQFRRQSRLGATTMPNSTLGSLHFQGGEYPISYVNEGVQVGFRLAHRLNLPTVWALDHYCQLEAGQLYEEAAEQIPAWAEEVRLYQETVKEIEGRSGVTGVLQYVNSPSWYGPQHSLFYLWPSLIGAGQGYSGAEYLLRWYERNIKTFANLLKLSLEYDRIFVLWGAGHLPILRELIQGCQGLRLVCVDDFLTCTTRRGGGDNGCEPADS